MRVFELRHATTVPRGLEDTFAFFSDVTNLARLTPARFKFEILTPLAVEMRVGTVMDYKLRVRGLPIRWQSEITMWEPPHRFVDEQVRGPYRLWRHEHRFEVVAADETKVIDDVRYAVRGGAIVNRFLVRPDLDRMFEDRTRALREIFGEARVEEGRGEKTGDGGGGAAKSR